MSQELYDQVVSAAVKKCEELYQHGSRASAVEALIQITEAVSQVELARAKAKYKPVKVSETTIRAIVAAAGGEIEIGKD